MKSKDLLQLSSLLEDFMEELGIEKTYDLANPKEYSFSCVFHTVVNEFVRQVRKEQEEENNEE